MTNKTEEVNEDMLEHEIKAVGNGWFCLEEVDHEGESNFSATKDITQGQLDMSIKVTFTGPERKEANVSIIEYSGDGFWAKTLNKGSVRDNMRQVDAELSTAISDNDLIKKGYK